MGAANIRAVAATPGLVLHSAFDRPGSPAIGRDAGEASGLAKLGVIISDDAEAALAGTEAIIDFTAPTVSVMLSEQAAARGLVHIIGTTGCSKEEDWAIAKSGSAGSGGALTFVDAPGIEGHVWIAMGGNGIKYSTNSLHFLDKLVRCFSTIHF